MNERTMRKSDALKARSNWHYSSFICSVRTKVKPDERVFNK